MPKVDVYDIKGNKTKTLDLNENVFGIEPNENIVHSVIVNYLANQRQGTQSTKSRSEVQGGGKKPHRQKGTGRARAGSIRSPLWVGGGVIFAPKPRSYKYRVNKKERQLAIRSVLSSKIKTNDIVVVDKLELKEIKTKNMEEIVKALKLTYILLPELNTNIYKSGRNIENLTIGNVDTMNVYEMVNNKKLLVTVDTIKKLEEVYA